MVQTTTPSYLPDDLAGLPFIVSNGSRYYYERQQDGTCLLKAQVFAKSHIVIRFPKGSTIEGEIPADSVGSAQIENGSIQSEDLSDNVKKALTPTYDQDGEGIKLGGL